MNNINLPLDDEDFWNYLEKNDIDKESYYKYLDTKECKGLITDGDKELILSAYFIDHATIKSTTDVVEYYLDIRGLNNIFGGYAGNIYRPQLAEKYLHWLTEIDKKPIYASYVYGFEIENAGVSDIVGITIRASFTSAAAYIEKVSSPINYYKDLRVKKIDEYLGDKAKLKHKIWEDKPSTKYRDSFTIKFFDDLSDPVDDQINNFATKYMLDIINIFLDEGKALVLFKVNPNENRRITG